MLSENVTIEGKNPEKEVGTNKNIIMVKIIFYEVSSWNSFS